MRSPDRTRTSCGDGPGRGARAEVHRGFRAEDLLEAGLRPIDEERLGGRGSQRAEKVLHRLDGRVAASEPAAIEDGADAGVNPRQRDDHRKQHDRVNPGSRPRRPERRQHRKDDGEPCGQRRDREEDRRAALDEQVEELERVVVVSADEQKHERQRLGRDLEERERGLPGTCVAAEHRQPENQHEEDRHQPEQPERPLPPALAPGLARVAVRRHERDAVHGRGHEPAGQPESQQLVAELTRGGIDRGRDQQRHPPHGNDERGRVDRPDHGAPGAGHPARIRVGDLRQRRVHDDRRERECQEDGGHVELPGSVERHQAIQHQPDVAAEPQQADDEEHAVDGGAFVSGRRAQAVARGPAPAADERDPEKQDRAVRERAERVDQQRDQAERSHGPRIRSGQGRRKRNRMSGGCSA